MMDYLEKHRKESKASMAKLNRQALIMTIVSGVGFIVFSALLIFGLLAIWREYREGTLLNSIDHMAGVKTSTVVQHTRTSTGP